MDDKQAQLCINVIVALLSTGLNSAIRWTFFDGPMGFEDVFV